MNAPRMVLKPVKLDIEKLKPLLKEVFSHYGPRAAQEAEENPELLITSLLLLTRDTLAEGSGCVLVEDALFETSMSAARELLANK